MTLKPAATAGVLAVVALLIYGSSLSRAQSPLVAAEVALARQEYSIAQTGRDLDGRLLPLFVHSEAEVWFPAIPSYSAILAVALLPTSAVAVRWSSVAFGVATLVLVYRLGLKCFSGGSLPPIAFGLALLTPALYMWSRRALDGIHAVPFVLASMISVLSFLDGQRSRHLWSAGFLLGVGVYASTTAPVQMSIFAVLAALVLWVAGYQQSGIFGRIALGFVLPLVCLVPWFVLYPESYPDTFGRWAIHAAHIRNPVEGLRAMVNWGSLTNRATVYWELLNPAFLFFPPEQPMPLSTPVAGSMAAAFIVLIPMGIARIGRACSPAVAVLLLAGFAVAPLAAATFGEDRAMGRALVMLPIGALIATYGIESLFAKGRAGQVVAAFLLLLVGLQFAFVAVSS